ncbi:MAG: ATP-binding protein [Thermodesulfovibrionia bacterium]|nr:ATP-binding protein [Thermodesulfovibrionia bacterium]
MAAITYRGQLVIIYSLLTFLFIFSFFSALYFITTGEINALTDNLLIQMANEKISDFQKNPEKYPANEVIEILGESHFKIIKTDTGVLLKSFEMPRESYINNNFLQQVRDKGRIYMTIKTPTGSIRTLFISFDEKYIIQTALPMITQENLLLKTRNLFISMIAAALFLTPIIGWILAGKAVKPIVKLTEEAHVIADNNLKKRLSFKYKGIEFSNLSLALNSILERIERFTENQKRLVSDISHEIRSPLTAIKGNIEVTLRRRRSVEEYEETLKKNLDEINRIILIANNLLFLTKADTGGVDLNIKEINLGQMLERVVVNKKHVIAEKNLNIETIWDEIIFYGDEILLSQLFLNVFDNAIQYTPAGGSISINASKTNSGVTVSVKDTGVGIPSNEIEKIFDRFYRVRQNLNMHETGSGLGLYLSRWIAEAHRGKITVESNIDKGSIFRVYLPFTKTASP